MKDESEKSLHKRFFMQEFSKMDKKNETFIMFLKFTKIHFMLNYVQIFNYLVGKLAEKLD